MKYDATFKSLFSDVKALFTLLTGHSITRFENIEYASVKQRRADLVAWLDNQELLHLELQSSPDAEMLWREWEYCGLIAERYGQIPRQIVLYIGNKAPKFKTEIDSTDVKFRYHRIDIRDIDCTPLTESDSLSDNLLALLGRLQNKREVMQQILRKMTQLEKNQRADMLEKLVILSGLRPAEIPQLIAQELNEMPITIDLDENPLLVNYAKRVAEQAVQHAVKEAEARAAEYARVQEEIGEARGKHTQALVILQRLLEKRFGRLPEAVNTRLQSASTEQLEGWSERLFDATCLEDVFSI